MIDKLFLTNLKVVALPPEMERNAYIGIRPDWPELSGIINKAIDAITDAQHTEIKKKWVALYTEGKEDQISLDPEEQAWLAQGHTVRVRVANAEPYIFVSNEKPQGIAVDLLNVIGRKTGIAFRFIMDSPSFAEDLKTIARHQGPDLISAIMRTPEREAFLLFAKNYASSPRFIFTRDDSVFIRGIGDLSGRTVAVVKAFVVHKHLEKNHSEIKLVVCKNVEDALRAVSSGKAFAFIGDLNYVPMMINRLRIHNLKMATPSSLPDHVSGHGDKKRLARVAQHSGQGP